MFSVENGHFSNFLFLGNIWKENNFYGILERKNEFLGYKNNKFRKSKNWHFSKGVNPWFRSKNGYFWNFLFLANIGQENVFYDIVELKKAILGYEKKKFKKWKNWHFSKGVNAWFWCKKGPFFKLFFFRQYTPGKCLLRYSRAKKSLTKQ